MPPSQLATIPLKLILPHPKLACRFDYKVTSLADSIKSAADENTPNGQLNPGRVVLREDGKGYYAYIGIRRYYALTELYEATKDERFGVYVAYIDTGLTELQMFIRAKKENDEEQGERLGFSVLEEVIGIGRIRGSVKDPNEVEGVLRRLLDVSGRVGEDKLRKLHEVEQQSGFRFRLAHLERLAAIEDPKEFYLSAATMAGFHLSSDEAEKALESRDAARNFKWFRGVFPEYAQDTGSQDGSKETGEKEAKKKEQDEGASAKGTANKDEEEKRFPVFEEGVVVVSCPTCSALYGRRIHGKVEATSFSMASPEEERVPEVPETVSRFARGCESCQKEFYAFVKHVGGTTYAVETSLSKKFREPRTLVEAVDLGFDHDKNEWLKLKDGRPVGVFYRPPSASVKKQRGSSRGGER
jgi:hypothetical protein